MRRLDPPALEGAGGGRRADEGFFEVGGEGFGAPLMPSVRFGRGLQTETKRRNEIGRAHV